MKKIENKIRYSAVSAIIMVFILLSCTSSNSPTGNNTGAPPANNVWIQNFAFNPATITVPVNTTVTWTNKDATDHTVTSDTGLFDSGTVNPTKTFSFTFTTAGTFSYHCKIHTYMTATVVVQ